MAEAIRRYGIFVAAAGIILAALILWFVLTRSDFNKVPSRGVFVDAGTSSCQQQIDT